MEVMEHTFVERKGWAPGPWDAEPDKVQWPDAETGLPCIARRGPSGNWCGYVALPAGHPWREQAQEDYQRIDVEVHGGLTFASFCDGDEKTGICHVPGPGEEDPAYWIGFDCHHSWDLAPGMQARDRERYERALADGDAYVASLFNPANEVLDRMEYRTLDYVKTECASLAKQVAAGCA